MKGEYIIKKIFCNEIFGEIGLFHENTSLYSFVATEGSLLIKITYDEFKSIFGDCNKQIVQNV